MKCRIDKGGKQVFTPNNERSKLFDKLYNIMGKDFQKALDVYSITETPEFKDYQDVLSKITPNARVESTDPIVFQSVLERLQQSGLSDNIFQLNTKDMLNKVKGLINPRFIIDVRGAQTGRQFNIRKTDEELRQILKQGGRFPIEDIVDISSMKNLVPNMDFSNTYIEFNYDNNWKSEISATLLVSGREIRGIKFDYAEVGNIRAELSILLGHELQHTYDIANQLPSGASIKEINNQVQQRFGDISGRITENSGEYSLSAENGVGLGIYLAKRGEQRARINSLQEFGIPNSKNDEYEPRIEETLLWDDFSEVKEQDLQNYYDIAINYYYNTRNPANEVITPIPNGFVVTENGRRNIYLNSDNLNLDTLLHENGHLFLDTLKQRFPEHYQAGLELLTKNSVEAQPYADYVNATQPNLERYSEAWKNEVLAQIIGSKGEQLIKSRKKNTIKDWLNDFWDFIAKSFGLTSYTPSEVANMTLQEFSDAVNVEMLSGNDLGGVGNEDIRFQIIGELGAEALDNIEDVTNRIDNLKIAKQMTESGKTPLEIRLATGWELGVDGKWKYEVDDFEIKNTNIVLDKNHEYFDTKVGIYELKDLVDVNNEVFKAYPEIKKQKIVFVSGFSEGTNMVYSNGTIFISYEKFNENGRFKDELGTLHHEVQHHLQATEGFGKGGNDQQYYPQVEEYFQKLKRGNNNGVDESRGESKLTRIIKEEFNKRVRPEDRDLVILFQDLNAIRSVSFGVYKRLSGEVEARNVQERLLLTPQQRRQKLLSETADVREEDQLVIFDAFEQMDSINYQNFQNNNLRSHMFVQNGTRLGSLRTKPVQDGEKVDSVVIYEDYRNQGLGTELYLETVRNLMVEGKKLYSDDSQTAPARKIWENLVNMGLAIQTSTNNFETINAPSWMTPETTIDEVISNQPIDRSEPSLQELMNFINITGESTASKSEVIELMQASDIIDSQELKENLAKAEEQGVFIFTEQSLRSTGVFDRFEIYNILESKERQRNIKQILKWLRTNDDFEIQPTSLEKGGTLQSSGKIQYQTPQTEVTSQDIDGNIIKSPMRLSQTIIFDYNETLSNNIAFLNQIVRETTWDNLSNQVKDILTAIEVSAIDNGIDLTGLRDKYHSASRTEILDFLENLEQTLEGSIEVNVFENTINEFLNFSNVTFNKDLSNTEVLVSDNLPQDIAYTSFNLLKVSPLVYKRVPQISYEDLLTIESQRLSVARNILDQQVNQGFDRSIEDTEVAKTLYLLRSNLNSPLVNVNPNTTLLNTFKGNFEYITEQFTKDFGKWLIESKNNMFMIDFRGITLTDTNQSELAFESVPSYLQEDLLEYSKLSKHLNFNRQFEEVLGLDEIQVQRDEAINNPESVKEYVGDYIELNNEDAIVIRNGQGQFIRIEGVVFEQVEEEGNLVYYKPLPNITTPLMEIDLFKPTLQSTPYEYTAYQTQATNIENLNRRTNRTDYEC